MGISSRTLKIIWAKSGGKCAFPGCGRDLISEDSAVVGENCHIIAQKVNGPRGKEISKSDINGQENLILLCKEHHTMVDACPEKYTSDILRKYKKQHEENVKDKLKVCRPWNSNFSQIYYMNLIRIEMLAAQQGIDLVYQLGEGQCLHSLGYGLNYLMMKIESLVELIRLNTKTLTNDWTELSVGQFVDIRANFYTKNVPTVEDVNKNKYTPTGDLEKDAHLHRKYGKRKCVLTLNPKWLCTDTSFVNFRFGRVDVAGFGLITALNDEMMIITPYILGVPKMEFDIFNM